MIKLFDGLLYYQNNNKNILALSAINAKEIYRILYLHHINLRSDFFCDK